MKISAIATVEDLMKCESFLAPMHYDKDFNVYTSQAILDRVEKTAPSMILMDVYEDMFMPIRYKNDGLLTFGRGYEAPTEYCFEQPMEAFSYMYGNTFMLVNALTKPIWKNLKSFRNGDVKYLQYEIVVRLITLDEDTDKNLEAVLIVGCHVNESKDFFEAINKRLTDRDSALRPRCGVNMLDVVKTLNFLDFVYIDGEQTVEDISQIYTDIFSRTNKINTDKARRKTWQKVKKMIAKSNGRKIDSLRSCLKEGYFFEHEKGYIDPPF